MKIFIYSTVFWPQVGGFEIMTGTLAKTLVKEKHNVLVFTHTPLGGQNELDEGYKIVRQKILNFWGLFGEIRNSDLIISNGGVALKTGVLALVLNKPHIIYHHSSGPYWLAGPLRWPLIRHLISWLIVKHAKIQIGVSHSCLKNRFLPASSKKRVIYNPVNDEIETKKISKRDIDLLFVGRMVREKGVEVLLNACSLLEKEKMKFKVVFVGDGPLASQVKEASRTFKNIKLLFLGLKPPSSLGKIYQRTKVLIFPSLIPEGMPLVLVEAFHFGIPIIGSDESVIREVAEKAGIYFPVGDFRALAKKINELIKSKSLWKNMSFDAKKRSKRFSIQKYNDEIRDVLKSMNFEVKKKATLYSQGIAQDDNV